MLPGRRLDVLLLLAEPIMTQPMTQNGVNFQLLSHAFNDARRQELLAECFSVPDGRPGFDEPKGSGIADYIKGVWHGTLAIELNY